MFAAAALRVLGFPPLLLDLEAVQDTDHVVAVFRMKIFGITQLTEAQPLQ